jgi:tetratricopeptide (TPR) repeat protein
MPYQSEIEKLEQRFREKPEQWFAALADAYRKAGEVERALDVVRAGLEKRPNYTSGHIVLGRCLLDQLNDPEAAQAFERVLQLDAENIIALKSLSEIAERQGDGGAARRWLDRLLEVDPMNDGTMRHGPPSKRSRRTRWARRQRSRFTKRLGGKSRSGRSNRSTPAVPSRSRSTGYPSQRLRRVRPKPST